MLLFPSFFFLLPSCKTKNIHIPAAFLLFCLFSFFLGERGSPDFITERGRGKTKKGEKSINQISTPPNRASIESSPTLESSAKLSPGAKIRIYRSKYSSCFSRIPNSRGKRMP